MELEDTSADVVHPEVRAHITSLVSALGGRSADEDGRYRLGDDALEVLRDLKRWIRFHDEKTNRMDVARCIAEANLIDGDLLPILATWPENATENGFKARIALACIELMVPLTWPIERNVEKMTLNHHRHVPVLRLAQLGYKRAIINFDGARILHAAVRVALPAMAIPIGDRSARDQGVIKLMLFFLRNVAQIVPPPDVKIDGVESQVSRSATIDAFSYQDIFLVILTIASNMGGDFRTEDVIIMEIIFHLVKRVDIRKLFMDEQQLHKTRAGELAALMNKEATMLKAYNRKGPTRHNRFGTMIWVKRDDGKMSSISGQDALADAATRQQKMDNTKTFRPPRRARKDDMEPKDLGPAPKLNSRANSQLRSFVEDFLDSGFNPLFQHVRKSIDREAPHVLGYHRRQFFYLVAWFLEAERTRRNYKKAQPVEAQEVSSFNLVAGVLDQSMFITLNRAMQEFWEAKEWSDLAAAMRCFTQILLTVQEMWESPNEEHQEIAENMLSRLFYHDATHDLVVNIMRQFKDQGFDYLDAATELTHNFLRILEGYSKQNVDMQVQSRRRVRRKRQAAKTAGEDVEEDADDNSENDEANAERITKERKFDFTRFVNRFCPQGVVDTFATFTKFYKDLDEAQLKRAHRYFYRLAFKQEVSVMLFRVDIIHLLYNMIKGPEPLDKSTGTYKEWEELVKQILRKCFKKVEERPGLLVEMLFSKISSTVFFLEHGYEKLTISSNPKPAAELEFRHTEDRAQQIAIVVGVLLDRNQSDHINWVKRQLTMAESERRAWETVETVMTSVETQQVVETQLDGEGQPERQPPASSVSAAPIINIRPDDGDRKTAMFKNSHLRLLMKLCGFQRLAPLVEETPDSAWIVHPDVTADSLKEALDFINQAEFSPPVFEEGGLAEHQLRRKTVPRKRAAFDDDIEGELDDDEVLFASGPSQRIIDGPDQPKKNRRRRRHDSDEESLDEEVLREKAARRRERELEKILKIKSEMYVHDSDDETDEERDKEFYARERAIMESMTSLPTMESQLKPSKKRKAAIVLEDSSDEDSDSAKSLVSSRSPVVIDDDSDVTESDDTPLSSSPNDVLSQSRKKRKLSRDASPEATQEADKGAVADVEDDGDDDDDVLMPVARRPRTHGGFVIDSSDEE